MELSAWDKDGHGAPFRHTRERGHGDGCRSSQRSARASHLSHRVESPGSFEPFQETRVSPSPLKKRRMPAKKPAATAKLPKATAGKGGETHQRPTAPARS